jgi:hypothetical protein
MTLNLKFAIQAVVLGLITVAAILGFNLTYSAIAQTGGLGYYSSVTGSAGQSIPLPPGATNRAFMFPATVVSYPDRIDLFGACVGDACSVVVRFTPEQVRDGATIVGTNGFSVRFRSLGNGLFGMTLLFNGIVQNDKSTVRINNGVFGDVDLRI